MTTPLLERLLNCKESTNFIIIEDTVSQSGYILLKEFIKEVAVKQDHRVVLLCFEISPKWLLENIDPQQNIEIFDAYSKSEAYDLEDDITLTDSCDNYNFIKNFNDLSEITNIIKDTIHKNTNINRVIAVYHSDIPNYPTSGTSGYLNVRNTLSYHIASTTIIIKNTEQFRKGLTSPGYITTENHAIINAYMNAPEGSICIIEHRKRSGRVLYEINSYNITESSDNIVIQLVKDMKDDIEPENYTPDPTTANLLFNLSLTESQKKAKNELVLPYVKIQDQYKDNHHESVVTV
ncbi:11229_t:CDS:2 [Funneliformis mosseae]|uniref:Elongator complex protein 5 n=1 Tax=Funneliformis mosseae TaxID=27381 RepID=A0A9N8VLR1_FUNMO|nr:11229_t:CDS:2 [Funneliformis mosseae]